MSEVAGLSQWERVVDSFVAPTKTFVDVKRSQSWWLPFVISLLFTGLFAGAVQWKVGWMQVATNAIAQDAKQQERMATLAPAQRDAGIQMAANITKYAMYSAPITAIIIVGIIAAVLVGTINFGFGGKAKFMEVFAVQWYAGLPAILKSLLGTLALLFGLAPESLNIKNFAGSNIAYFLDPGTTNKMLYALLSSLDVITIWTLVLAGLGLAIVAGVKKSSGMIAVFGWWALIVVFQVVAAAFA